MSKNVLHFPTHKTRKPTTKVDLYKKLSLLIKKNPNIENPTQVWLFMSWLLNDLFQTRSVKVNSEKLAQTLIYFYEDNDKFYVNELNILCAENKEKYIQILYQIHIAITKEVDRQNAIGLASLLLYIKRKGF
ncbi:MAG: hypothetical protein L3J07_01035 [Candidatus Magasanikbacteria bacterium]|nr:hypothetical protein [Candidatus Magasanikbacteria bacterium]